MIRSMTGFGKCVEELPNQKISVEIKSLNSKQLDLSVKMPFLFREKELELRSFLMPYIQRGKAEINIFIEKDKQQSASSINTAILNQHLTSLFTIAEERGLPKDDLLNIAMRMPDVMTVETSELEEDEWKVIMIVIQKAVEKFDAFRMEEGQVLEKDFKHRIYLILALLDSIGAFEDERITAIKERLKTNIEKLSESNIDDNRFEQEMFFYIEKLDITEEKIRLKKHCDYFLDTLDEDSAGKKLGFVTQEIGREINTIGSKANNVDIQKIVVGMKDELEKIKEQLGNIL